MTLDFDAQAIALAARFDAGVVTPPSGFDNIVVSTADIPEALPRTPCVLVFLEEGNIETGNGTRLSVHRWTIRFYYGQITDLPRQNIALRKWAGVLVDQLRGAVQLGGTVARATIDGYTVGMLRYGNATYAGIEFKASTVTTEGWAAVA